MSAATLAAWIIGGAVVIALLLLVIGGIRLFGAMRAFAKKSDQIEAHIDSLKPPNLEADLARIARFPDELPPLIERARAALVRLETAIRILNVTVQLIRHFPG